MMNRREFIKAAGVGAVGLMTGGLTFNVEGRVKTMKIKAVKLYENGFMTQPFACGLEDGEDKFDATIKYRSTIQNYLINCRRTLLGGTFLRENNFKVSHITCNFLIHMLIYFRGEHYASTSWAWLHIFFTIPCSMVCQISQKSYH